VKAHGIPRHGDITLEVHSAPLRWTPGWTKGAIPSMPLAQQWNLRTFGQTQADGNPPVCPYKEQGTIPEDMSTEVPPPPPSPPKHQSDPLSRGRASRALVIARLRIGMHAIARAIGHTHHTK